MYRSLRDLSVDILRFISNASETTLKKQHIGSIFVHKLGFEPQEGRLTLGIVFPDSDMFNADDMLDIVNEATVDALHGSDASYTFSGDVRQHSLMGYDLDGLNIVIDTDDTVSIPLLRQLYANIYHEMTSRGFVLERKEGVNVFNVWQGIFEMYDVFVYISATQTIPLTASANANACFLKAVDKRMREGLS